MRLAWVTDPHLNFIASAESFGAWVLKTAQADALVLTGDIAEYPSLSGLLAQFLAGFNKPIYFVLGNHDYYFGKYEAVRQAAHIISQSLPNLIWLDEAGIIELTSDTALVGNGGWYDLKSGMGSDTPFRIHDLIAIPEFKDKPLLEVADRCKWLTESMAQQAMPYLLEAAKNYKQVFFATHVPPFREATWHLGKLSDSEALPWFCNLTFGQMLSSCAHDFPDTNFTVLCGHTHSPGTFDFLPNMRVLSGKSEYRNPQVSKIFTL